VSVTQYKNNTKIDIFLFSVALNYKTVGTIIKKYLILQ
jgi:hypothetical protein